jgi:hypothetical protein
MTTPNGSAPDGAYVVGGQYGQDITEASAKAIMTGKTKTAFGNAQDQHRLNVGNPLSALFGITTGLNSEFQEQRENQIALENRVEQLLSGGTRWVYMLSTTWTNPGPGKMVGVAILNAGMSGSGINGGTGAKYVYQEWKSDVLPSSVSITVATAAGGISRFGTLLAGSWSGGGVFTPEGIMQTAGNAGDGGRGADFIDPGEESAYVVPGTAGTGNALAAGGVYNASGAGGQGADASSLGVATAGGGGGGGGGYFNNLTDNRDLRGGPGGWPGGGGGGGGEWKASIGTGNVRHAGGAGAPGAVFVTVRG